jgi:hypothetical protein
MGFQPFNPSVQGFANPMTTAGDLIDGGASGAAQRLAVGTTGQVLTVSGGAPAWEAVPGWGQAAPLSVNTANPTGTTSTSPIYAGFANATPPTQYAPIGSGLVLISVVGYAGTNTATAGLNVGLRYGPAAAPNADATTVAAGSNGGEISTIASWTSPSAGVLDVASTTGWATSGFFWVPTSSTIAKCSYTGTTPTSLTGCAYVGGSATGTISTAGAVTAAPQNGASPQGESRAAGNSDQGLRTVTLGDPDCAFGWTAVLSLMAGIIYWIDITFDTGSGSDAAEMSNCTMSFAELP